MKVIETIDLGILKLEILERQETQILNLFLPQKFDSIELKNKIPIVEKIMQQRGFEDLLVIGIPRSWNVVVKRFCHQNGLFYVKINDYTCCILFSISNTDRGMKDGFCELDKLI